MALRINTPDRKRAAYRAAGRLFLEFMPLLCVVFLICMCCWYAFRHPPVWVCYPHTIAYYIGAFLISALWLVFGLLASLFLNFCRLHRNMILYVYIVALCLYVDRWFGFGPVRFWLLLAAICAGVILVAVVIDRMIFKRLCNK